jgi:hypothetical protein
MKKGNSQFFKKTGWRCDWQPPFLGCARVTCYVLRALRALRALCALRALWALHALQALRYRHYITGPHKSLHSTLNNHESYSHNQRKHSCAATSTWPVSAKSFCTAWNKLCYSWPYKQKTPPRTHWSQAWTSTIVIRH